MKEYLIINMLPIIFFGFFLFLIIFFVFVIRLLLKNTKFFQRLSPNFLEKSNIIWGYTCVFFGILSLHPGINFFIGIPTITFAGISTIWHWKKKNRKVCILCGIGLISAIIGFVFLISVTKM